MKAVVVGGNGFIGSHLVDRLAELGWRVLVLDIADRRYEEAPPGVQFVRGDLTQSYLLREVLTGVDVVFHLAWTTIHETANQDPAADVAANLVPAINLFETCLATKVGRVIFTSSGGAVYGRSLEVPIKESHPLNPINGYGITKLATEKYLQMYAHLKGLDYAILRPSVPYGPRQNPLGKQGAAAVFLYRVAQGLPLTIWGDGSTVRDFFYIEDLVRGLIRASSVELQDERIFNLGSGRFTSLLDLLQLVEETVGREAQVNFREARMFDADKIVLDTTLAGQALDWSPQISLAEGLSRTWDWMTAHLLQDQNKE